MTERNAERPGSLLESHKGYDPRLILFYFGLVALLVILVGGLASQQLIKTNIHSDRERIQNQRRVLVPGPRGNIFDRNGNLLVGNRPRFSVTLHLDELRVKFRKEFYRIEKAFRAEDERNIPSDRQISELARITVVQRYLDEVNKLTGRSDELDSRALSRQFNQERLLPFVLIDDLAPEEYARLIEQLPVTSPLQVYTSSTRHYPYGSAAAHTLGYVGSVELEDFPGEELKTFKRKGTEGRSGLERRFDTTLQGETGGTTYRVDHAGYRVNPPLQRKLPVQGNNIITSLDIDLQIAAEAKMSTFELAGAAVAIDVATGEVLVLASKPDFNLADTSPRILTATADKIEATGAWENRAIRGVYPPGSTFKIINSIAGVRSGATTADTLVNCEGLRMVGKKKFVCHDGHAHGPMHLVEGIEKSCNVFFYDQGLKIGPQALAEEARRFHLDEPSGIELPSETTRMLVPDPAWKKRVKEEAWYEGDTANFSIGQGFLGVTPMQMACFVASFARGEATTRPTLIHQPDRPRVRTAPIGLSPEGYRLIVRGMEQCVLTGTAKTLSARLLKIPDLSIAGKTGTAQVGPVGKVLNIAWFICFAPVERPEIAIAVMIEGDTPGEEFGGATYSAPVAHAILKKWWEEKETTRPGSGSSLS